MREYVSESVADTERIGETLARSLSGGTVVALFGGLGMGKTAFVRGMAKGRGIAAEVSSPTFALVNEYGGTPPLVHFDMYRITGWDDLYSTGYFDYIDAGCILAVEWSENIVSALPHDSIRVTMSALGETGRRIVIQEGEDEI